MTDHPPELSAMRDLPLSPPLPTVRRGRCTLVGAGPGDPDLLTVKAVKAMAQATLVLVDDLVSDEVIALIPATTRLIHVGKRGGCRSTPQEFIHRLMVQAVQEGEQVVRLKGGDPFIFGRGGEEVERLQAEGVTVEVVNGITAGLAAASSLGAALTHREHAQGVVFMTGHAKPGASGPDWANLARTCHQLHLTLVVYMGVRSAAEIARGLAEGLPGLTPVAIVQSATLPEERQVVTVLSRLGQTLVEEQMASPSVIIVGNVLRGLLAATQRGFVTTPLTSAA
jgi:uroporphyrin-III C-methyltransferase